MLNPLALLINLPEKIASYFLWAGPLVARLIVGYAFMISGWNKLNNLETITVAFTEWGIPFPEILTPIVSGWEFVGGLLLIVGLITRITSGGLAVIMIVAITSVQIDEVMSLSDLTALPEATYFTVFTWLAINGAGQASLDFIMKKKNIL